MKHLMTPILRVPMGFDIVFMAMATIFLFSSPDMKAHAVRRCPFLSCILKANKILPSVSLKEERNEMQLNNLQGECSYRRGARKDELPAITCFILTDC